MGSEMCIRDRGYRADAVGLGCAERHGHEDVVVGVVLEFSRLEACLLYTSDAADERSSVDLGGRRIIKKKKS